MRSFEKVNFKDYKYETIQKNTDTFLIQLKSFPMFKGNLLKDIELSATALNVPHRLGRTPEGYLITKKNANATVWNGEMDQSIISLTASGNVTVDLWIY